MDVTSEQFVPHSKDAKIYKKDANSIKMAALSLITVDQYVQQSLRESRRVSCSELIELHYLLITHSQ